MVEVEKQVLRRKLKELEECVVHIRAELPATAAELEEDFHRRQAILHSTQLAGQIGCDVALHILAAEVGGAPSDYRAAVLELGTRRVLPGELATRLAGLAGLRDVIVHGYDHVDLARLHKTCREDLGDLDAFAAAIAARYSL